MPESVERRLSNQSDPTAERRYTLAQEEEIGEARATSAPTRRPTSTALEEVMFEPMPVLDRGFVRVVDYMGDDAAVVQGARVSFGRGTKQVSGDRGLIRYLMRNRHSTPFELADLKLHVRAPIFVTRQWFRHRTASINEYSARYSVLEREFYMPAPEVIAAQSGSNRQGRGEPMDEASSRRVLDILRDDASRTYDNYLTMLNETDDGGIADPERQSVARELARINLPIGIYTQFYWKVDLWNLLRFLSLRADTHAQFEIRAYASVILDIVKTWVPIVHEAFEDYMMGSTTLSRQGLALIRAALSADSPIDPGAFGLSGRELRELTDRLPELASCLKPG